MFLDVISQNVTFSENINCCGENVNIRCNGDILVKGIN